MVVEDAQKSAITEDQNPSRVANDNNDDEDLSRIPGPSGSTTLPPSPNKPHGAAPSDPSTLSPPSKSFGGQASIFSLPFPPIFPLLGLNLIASFLILGSSDPCFFVLKFVQHLQ